jgi:hypothetical protein
MKKTVKGRNKLLRALSRNVSTPEGAEGHEFAQVVLQSEVASSDIDWDGAIVTEYTHDDSVNGVGTHRGYGTVTHTDGSTSQYSFSGTHEMTTHDDGTWDFELNGSMEWRGGTGKFKNIRGSAVYAGETRGGVEYDWEGDLEY